MYYLFSSDIYFYTTYHLSTYYITYKTLDCIYPVIVTESQKVKYRQTKKDMEFESNSLLALSRTHTEK